jgi:hypothetical protein
MENLSTNTILLLISLITRRLKTNGNALAFWLVRCLWLFVDILMGLIDSNYITFIIV